MREQEGQTKVFLTLKKKMSYGCWVQGTSGENSLEVVRSSEEPERQGPQAGRERIGNGA